MVYKIGYPGNTTRLGVFSMLEARVKAFLNSPFERMEKTELQQRLNTIGGE